MSGLHADIEDGHTLHLVERPEGLHPTPAPQGPPQERPSVLERIQVGMIDANGAVAAAGVYHFASIIQQTF